LLIYILIFTFSRKQYRRYTRILRLSNAQANVARDISQHEDILYCRII